MKRKTITHAARLLCVLALAMSMTTAAFAADPTAPAEPTAPTDTPTGERNSVLPVVAVVVVVLLGGGAFYFIKRRR